MSTRPGISNSETRLDDSPESLVGKVLNSTYRLDEVLSAGGMGIVFRATQMSVVREVAVKIIKPSLSRNNDLMTRFMQEVEVIGQLSHPNIVHMIDSGRDMAGIAFIAMEFVEGDTFRAALQGCQLSLLEILHVFIQVCDALTEAHHLGIIHRDLKFDNIMICRHQDNRIHVKVLDFGVAKQLSRGEHLTRTGEVPGTPGIIAPELVDGGDPSAQSDLYSLGVLLFTALTGRAPFGGQNDFEIMRAHKLQDVPDLYELVGDRVPEVIIELAYELMEKDPRMRPDRATDVRDRLELIIRRLERQMMDHPRYVPPPQEGLRPLHAPTMNSGRSAEFMAAREEPGEDRSDDAKVAPASVVGFLIALVILLSLVVIYLLFKQHVG